MVVCSGMEAKPPIELIEHGAWKIVDLAPWEFDALKDTNFVNVKPPVQGRCRITPGGKVGSVRVGSVQIDVRPKITELRRLLFFIGYCSNPKIWREEVVHLDKADGLFPAVSESFVRLAARALEGGLLQGYRTKNESLQVVRGRIDFTEQITRRHGLPAVAGRGRVRRLHHRHRRESDRSRCGDGFERIATGRSRRSAQAESHSIPDG
ncbi:5-methylcytosine restriction system specificity protein McrC [Nocardia beijingensis]|uniref:5-methylcytosine restriction system specificity protein McrC n=1 Tax=Nocardia beijingensis TaxID=95162 RepID=UPI000A040911